MKKENTQVKNPKNFLIAEKEHKKKSTLQIYLEILKECCSNSTSHGIPNIARSDNWIIKFFWFILLFGATAASVYCKF
jgi:hypothetical protein